MICQSTIYSSLVVAFTCAVSNPSNCTHRSGDGSTTGASIHTRIQTDSGYQTKLKPIKVVQVDDEVLAWDELNVHDNAQSAQSAQAAQTLHAAYQQANLSNKSEFSPINTGASSYENKSVLNPFA